LEDSVWRVLSIGGGDEVGNGRCRCGDPNPQSNRRWCGGNGRWYWWRLRATRYK
jgi:hypothetical protein